MTYRGSFWRATGSGSRTDEIVSSSGTHSGKRDSCKDLPVERSGVCCGENRNKPTPRSLPTSSSSQHTTQNVPSQLHFRLMNQNNAFAAEAAAIFHNKIVRDSAGGTLYSCAQSLRGSPAQSPSTASGAGGLAFLRLALAWKRAPNHRQVKCRRNSARPPE
jgi:hypothetical protein